jgi:hypothetical protein
MTIAQYLRNAVKRKDYNETAASIRKACEDVFGYQPKKECCSEDFFFNNKKIIAPLISVSVMQVTGSGIKFTETNMPEFIPKLETKPTNGRFDRCFHYGKTSRESSEGIITNLLYERNNDQIELICDEVGLPPVRVFGYGGDWMLESNNEYIPEHTCAKKNLEIPDDVLLLFDVGFDGFVKVIEKREKS